MRPFWSTPAIAIGVELKKRVKRTSEARNWAEESSPWVRLSTMVRVGPLTPSRLADTRCMKRTGSASPFTVARSRSMTAFRVVPGSALTERTSAMPSPATISSRVIAPGVKAGQVDAQPFGQRGVDIGDAAVLVGREEAGRRMVEMVDGLLQVEEEALLLGSFRRNVGELPGIQRLALVRAH